MKIENEEAMRRALATESNLMIINLKNAVQLAEQCRALALQEGEPLTPALGDVLDLMGDSAQLLRAFGVALSGVLEKLPKRTITVPPPAPRPTPELRTSRITRIAKLLGGGRIV